MRKYLILGLAAVAVAGMSSFAIADDIQSINAKLTPKKLPKKKFKPAKISVVITTGAKNDGSVDQTQPPKAYRTTVDFPRNMRFNTNAAPHCKVGAGKLDSTTTRQATQLCGKKSIVSVKPSDAEVWISLGPGDPLKVPVVVTAYNGKKKNTLYLHARADNVNTTSVLTGKLKKGPKGYGKRLDVTIPPLQAGAIHSFRATVKRGKYVQARCKQKRNKFRAMTWFHDWPKKVTDTTTTKCQQKKAKRKRNKRR